MLDLGQVGHPPLHPLRQLQQRGAGRHALEEGQDVQERADHLLDAGHLGRPPGERHPEAHGPGARALGEQGRPRGLEEAGERDPVLPAHGPKRLRLAGGQGDDRRRPSHGRAAQLLDHADAVDLREAEVEQDQIEGDAQRVRDRFLAVRRSDHAMPVHRQKLVADGARVIVVVDDKDPGGGAHRLRSYSDGPT